MSAVLVLVNILLALVAVVLIISVLMQEGTKQGLGAITGGAETFFGKNKAKSYEGKLELVTKIAAGVFIVLAIVSTILTSNISKNSASSANPSGTTASETVAPAETAVPEATTESEATAAPEATAEPEATAAPEATVAPEVTAAPEDTSAKQ